MIQAAMGWDNYHLYQFRLGKTFFSPPSVEDRDSLDFTFEDSTKTKVTDLVFVGTKAKLQYEYDFGDGWVHDVVIEKIVTGHSSRNIPACIGGKGACPPEDCGGPWGYYNLLRVLGNPKDEEYEEMKEWIGGSYEAESIDIDEANARLKSYEDY